MDVRVIATTNRDLEKCVVEGKFRQDLFYRLNVVPIDLPPLRNRAEDVPELCRHFLHQIARRENSAFRHIESEAQRMLQRYQWPGNVRELQNIIERATVLETEPGVVRSDDARAVGAGAFSAAAATPAAADLAGKPLADIEKQVILTTLQQFKGHRIKTAGALGIGVRTLGMKLKRWKEDGELASWQAHKVAPSNAQYRRSEALLIGLAAARSKFGRSFKLPAGGPLACGVWHEV